MRGELEEGNGRAARGSEAGEEEKRRRTKLTAAGYTGTATDGTMDALCSAQVVWLRTDNAEDKRICPCREKTKADEVKERTNARMKEWRGKKGAGVDSRICLSRVQLQASLVPSLCALSIQLSERSEHLLAGSTMGWTAINQSMVAANRKSKTNGGKAERQTTAISSLSNSDEGSRRRV